MTPRLPMKRLWSRGPRFVLVPHNPSFFKKISLGLAAIESMVAQLARGTAHAEKGSCGSKKGIAR